MKKEILQGYLGLMDLEMKKRSAVLKKRYMKNGKVDIDLFMEDSKKSFGL